MGALPACSFGLVSRCPLPSLPQMWCGVQVLPGVAGPDSFSPSPASGISSWLSIWASPPTCHSWYLGSWDLPWVGGPAPIHFLGK